MPRFDITFCGSRIQRVEEVRISVQLGVSRTPVREALIALEQEGLVRSWPQRGFVVVRPDVALVREIYPLLASLEAAAVRLAGGALHGATPRLRRLNRALAVESRTARQYDLDREFHATLTAGCGNARLLRLLDMERTRAQLVDGSHERGLANLRGSVAEHDGIVDALERAQPAAAADILTGHWENGIEVVARWLEER